MNPVAHSRHFGVIQQTLFFSLLALGTVGFFWLIKDYLMPVFWAVVLALMFYPIQQSSLSLCAGRKATAAILTLFMIFVIIFAPLWIVGSLVVKESFEIYGRIAESGPAQAGLINRTVSVLGALESYGISKDVVRTRLTSVAQTAADWLGRQAIVFGQATFSVAVRFLLMLYILFFLLRDGPAIGVRIFRILPLGKEREDALFSNFAAVTRATLKGTLMVSAVQGAIGGILFAIAGIEGALLWGVIMTILSILPAIGPALVWLPAGVILLLTGSVWQGVLILLGGVLVISTIDNILRPILVRRDVKMPDPIILISILGGLSIFGLSGFIIGPVIAGFFFSLWQIFEQDYRGELERHG